MRIEQLPDGGLQIWFGASELSFEGALYFPISAEDRDKIHHIIFQGFCRHPTPFPHADEGLFCLDCGKELGGSTSPSEA